MLSTTVENTASTVATLVLKQIYRHHGIKAYSSLSWHKNFVLAFGKLKYSEFYKVYGKVNVLLDSSFM